MARIGSILVNNFWYLKRVCILLLLDWVSHICQSSKVGWECCQVFHTVTDFLSTYPISYCERSIEVTKQKCEFVYFCFQFSLVWFHIFWISIVTMDTHLGFLCLFHESSPFALCSVSFYPGIVGFSKVYFLSLQ